MTIKRIRTSEFPIGTRSFMTSRKMLYTGYRIAVITSIVYIRINS